MSNQKALYRKYRPANFSELVGQDHIIKILQNSIINDSISHAYLFSGPRGTGKTSVAKIFSKAINCLRLDNGEPCGKCDICKIENNIDIIEIDAASNNGVDYIREITNNSILVPSYSKYKVYIIDEVHMLSPSSFNALLKTLEEPSKHVVFILATTEINKIPLTVISRCQRFDFKKISSISMKNQLERINKKEKAKISDNILNIIVSLADGGMRDAINLLEQVINIDSIEDKEELLYEITGLIKIEVIEKIFESVVNKKIHEGLSIINEMFNNGKNFVKIAEKMLVFVRDISINNVTHDYFDEKYKENLNILSNTDNEILIELMKIIIEMIKELNYSSNQKTVFEIYYLKIYELLNKQEKSVEKEEVEKEIIEQTIEENEIVEVEKSDFDILINNVLATADKKLLSKIREKTKEIDDLYANKTLSTAAKNISEGNIVAAGSRGLIIEFDNETNIDYINNNEDICKKVFKKLSNFNNHILGVSTNDWENIKEKYIKDIKKGIKYEVVDEIKSLTKKGKGSIIENAAVDIFGEDAVEIK